ncbi:MAG TPA: divalent cation tolerance protein CutA [Chloroflexota bacterium]
MSTEAQHVIAYSAFTDRAEALAMARSAVQKQLAAGADIREVTSVRPAEGGVEERTEYIVALQTATPMIEALKAHVVSEHSQKLPVFVVVPILTGHDKFLAWIDDYVNEGATAGGVGRNGSLNL